ncbi:MAG: sigma-70 family RNA polymerase sigma factor [Myxococcota bacterium]
MAYNTERGVLPDLDTVFREHAAFVMRVVRRMGVPERYVEDVSQEVFLVLHRRLKDYDPARPLRTWIYGIASRTALGQRRRAHHRRERLDSSPELPAVDPEQERAMQRAEARAVLDRALDSLDADKRTVFVAYDLEGIPMKEIASGLGWPLQTAYSRLHAARRRVRESVEATDLRRSAG